MNPIAKYVEACFIGKIAQKHKFSYKEAEEAFLFYRLLKLTSFFRNNKEQLRALLDAVR